MIRYVSSVIPWVDNCSLRYRVGMVDSSSIKWQYAILGSRSSFQSGVTILKNNATMYYRFVFPDSYQHMHAYPNEDWSYKCSHVLTLSI